MDSDFLRELGVLIAFMLLYLAGSAALLRGHHADLSAVQQGTGGRRSTDGTPRAAAGGEAPVRLNRRRKAIAREQAEAAARKAPVQIPALSDED